MMKSIGLLLVLSLAPAANAAPVPTGEGANPLPPGVTFAAAGGHDSVGGLIPLSLWPPYTPRVYAPAPAARVWKRRGRRCITNPCSH